MISQVSHLSTSSDSSSSTSQENQNTFLLQNNSNESTIRYDQSKLKPGCKYLPRFNFDSFIQDKLNALSPVNMDDDEIDDIYEEIISNCFESSMFSN